MTQRYPSSLLALYHRFKKYYTQPPLSHHFSIHRTYTAVCSVYAHNLINSYYLVPEACHTAHVLLNIRGEYPSSSFRSENLSRASVVFIDSI